MASVTVSCQQKLTWNEILQFHVCLLTTFTLVVICPEKFKQPSTKLYLQHLPITIHYIDHPQHTGWAKKLHTAFFAITLPTLNLYTIGNLQLDDA